MIIECPRCKTRYKINDKSVPVGGGLIECIECGNIFTIFREPMSIMLTKVDWKDSETEFQSQGKRKKSTSPSLKMQETSKSDKTTESLFEGSDLFKSQEPKINKTDEDIFSGFKQGGGLKETSLSQDFSNEKKKSGKNDFSLSDFSLVQSETKSKPKSSEFNIDKALFDETKEDSFSDDISSISDEFNLPPKPPPWKKTNSSSLEDFFNIPKTPDDNVKDMAKRVVKELKLYFPKEAEEAARVGKVPSNLLNEIKKALQYYRTEATKEIEWDKAMTFFRDAINEIIGQGKILFR